jgi:hypothetical protein
LVKREANENGFARFEPKSECPLLLPVGSEGPDRLANEEGSGA